jgi:type IV pilus assembly protein PilQ
MRNFFRVFFVLTVALAITSCSTQRPESKQGNELIKPEQFAVDRAAGIDRSVALGPKVAINSQRDKAIKRNERRQINKTEGKNYIGLSSSGVGIFPITMNFANISVQDMAIMFSEVTGRNILVGDEVDGKVTAKIINVSWDKALDAVLKTKKLAKTIDHKANIIRIHKQDVLVAQEEFDRKRIEDMQKSIEAQHSIEPIYTEIFKLYYTDSKIIKAELEAVFGSGGDEAASSNSNFKITVDERLNSLIIQATKTELDLVARLIAEVDVRTKQVLIEAFIVEADDTYSMKLGSKFGVVSANNLGNLDGDHYDITGTGSGGALVADAAGSAQFILNTSSSVLKIELSADEQNGITKIISNPKVFTLDNQEAIIKQVVQIPYKVVQEGEVTYEFKEAGLILTVTPSIVGDGNIILSVNVEKSSAIDIAGTDFKSIDSNEIKTKLLVQDNTVVVIGGVFTQDLKDTSSKVPLIGDIPLFGNLFKIDSNSDRRKELLIFLAPRII